MLFGQKRDLVNMGVGSTGEKKIVSVLERLGGRVPRFVPLDGIK